MKRNRSGHARRGIAATEMAILAPFLLTLLMGIWEVGRYIMIQNLLENAVREGGRLGASGTYFSSNNHNDPTVTGATLTVSPPATNGDYEVQQKMQLYLAAAGVTTTGMTVTVSNSGSPTGPKTWAYTWKQSGGSSGSGYDPTAAATQLDTINITIVLPYQNVSWSPLSWFLSQQATLSATTSWSSMRDIPLSVSTAIPSKPLQPTDPLP
jgi:Flp pilus assembly protein TadG